MVYHTKLGGMATWLQKLPAPEFANNLIRDIFFILQVLLANVDPYPRPRSFTQFFFFSM